MSRRTAVALLFIAGLVTFAARSNAQQHPNLEKGFKPGQAYALSDIDEINLFNGNLNVGFPIGGTYKVGGVLSYGFTLAYSGNNWDYESAEDVCVSNCEQAEAVYSHVSWAVPYKRLNAGMGWLFGLGRLLVPPNRGDNGLWVYQAPDGSEHTLYPKLRHPNDTPDDDVYYSRSGSYIRHKMQRSGVEIVSHKLEFADGTIKTFGADGMLLTISDRFDNVVTITPPLPANTFGIPVPDTASDVCGTSYVTRKVSDGHRIHYIHSLPAVTATGFEERVCQASLAAFGTGQQLADYRFKYTNRAISRQGTSSPLPEREENQQPVSLLVPLLTKVLLPSGASYDFVYDIGRKDGVGLKSNAAEIMVPNQLSDFGNGLGSYSGHLIELKTPTGGKYEWAYRTYVFSTTTVPPPIISPEGKIAPTTSAGVEERRKYLDGIPTPAVWKYLRVTPLTEPEGRTVSITRVESPDGAATEHYFSMWMSGGDRRYDYGAPYTRRQTGVGENLPVNPYVDPQTPNQELFLSSRTFLPLEPGETVPKQRVTYVTYEWAPFIDQGDTTDFNRRLKSRLTKFEDGREVKETFDDFDGLGHYRTSTMLSPEVERIVKTNYNPSGGVRVIPYTQDWIIGIYDKVEKVDKKRTPGSPTISESHTHFCFDSKGMLLRRRSLRGTTVGSNDLLAVFKDAAFTGGSVDGNVSQEEYYGGDKKALPAGVDTCAWTPTEPDLGYRLLHGYQYGSLKTTQYHGQTFKVLDLDIDQSTGLPSASRDTAGVSTTFNYDKLGRLTNVKPTGRAWPEFLYFEATPSAGASVIERQCPSGATGCASTALAETHYYYDSFGQLIQQRAKMGDIGTSSWSATAFAYDAFGRTEKSYVPKGVSSGSLDLNMTLPAKTQWSFDTLGRTKTITLPDGSVTAFKYNGTTEVERTSSIETETGAKDVTTVEEFDGLGRLVSVTEDAPNNEVIETQYEYDEGDRLMKVIADVQIRTFDYDGAGLLVEEKHPESAATSYEYDARGHMTKRVTDQSTLTFTYDAAERLTFVHHDPDGEDVHVFSPSLMKEFTFGPSLGTGFGRLESATRHNYIAAGDATVTEQYTYNSSGLLSSKATIVNIPGSPQRTFTDSYTYNPQGAIEDIVYPGCTGCTFVPARIAPQRTVTNSYSNGFLKRVNGFTSDILYHPNGLWSEIRRINAESALPGPLDTQTVAAHGMPRPESLSVSGHCSSFAITSHPLTKTVSSNGDSDLSVVAPGATSYQWYADDAIIPNETQSELHVPVAVTTRFWARVSNGTCTIDSNVSTVTVDAGCSVTGTITAPSGVKLGSKSHTATVPQSGTYSWSIQNGTITSATNTQSITFDTGCSSGNVTLTVQFTPACGGGQQTPSMVIPITYPVVTLDASPDTISQEDGQSTLTVTVNGGPWQMKWGDLAAPFNVTNSVDRPVNESVTTQYHISHVNGCSTSGAWASAELTVVPPPPVNTTATRIGPANVLVAWTVPPGAVFDSYQVERCTTSCNNPANWSWAVNRSSLNFNDGFRLPNTVYVYRVRSVRGGTASNPSTPDFASTHVFTDDPLPAQSAQNLSYLSELRTAVNALRQAAGLGAYNYTDALVPLLPLKAIHFTELLTTMNQARAAFGAVGVTFSPPVPAINTVPMAAHINELRGGVQ